MSSELVRDGAFKDAIQARVTAPPLRESPLQEFGVMFFWTK